MRKCLPVVRAVISLSPKILNVTFYPFVPCTKMKPNVFIQIDGK